MSCHFFANCKLFVSISSRRNCHELDPELMRVETQFSNVHQNIRHRRQFAALGIGGDSTVVNWA